MLFGHRVSKQPGLSRRQLCPSLFLSPPPCCSWLLFQLYGWPYVFFLLPNYSENFPGENWTSILLFDWIFLIEDLRIILKREKKKSIHPRTRLGCFTGYSDSELLLSSPLLVFSSWFSHAQPCKIQIITRLWKVADPTGFWICREVLGDAGEAGAAFRQAGSGEAGLAAAAVSLVQFHLDQRQQFHSPAPSDTTGSHPGVCWKRSEPLMGIWINPQWAQLFCLMVIMPMLQALAWDWRTFSCWLCLFLVSSSSSRK